VKLVIDVPPGLADGVREAVNRGGYESVHEFARIAVTNQVELETSETPGPSGREEAHGETSEPDEMDGLQSMEYLQESFVRRDYEDVRPLETPGKDRLSDGPLWGQYNRLLPVKVVLRRLANRLDDGASKDAGPSTRETSLDYESFSEEVADLARLVGMQLVRSDEALDRSRGEKLSTAFPTGDDSSKSKDRFRSHFVGRCDSEGNLRGAAPRLCFVDLAPEDERRIGITEPGLQFAELENPVLDGTWRASQALSEAEREFYLDHLREHVPREWTLVSDVLEAVRSGQNRPDQLTALVRASEPDWTESKADTVRSGLLGRMTELGLLTRKRVGQRGIAYHATESAETVPVSTREG